ncbi:MAG: hypothetical protein DHS20C17_29210 [Cyclobacteriaceae bacterium]|nr:MAG: hypothetical protein DHS20C17_29210 [Cyclobacteriaceae bacterium]
MAQTDNSEEWLILGPIPVAEGATENISEEQQRTVFKADFIDPAILEEVTAGQTIAIDNASYKWQTVQSKDQVVDLDKLFDEKDYMIAYAFKEFKVSEAKTALLGVGSDDGVRVWLNGELVHDNWVPRGVIVDDDLVPVSLRQGTNQILLKVQDMQQAWGFACRILPLEAYAEKITEAAGSGQVDDVNLLLSNGADINAKNKQGLTALHTAKIKGRKDIIEDLITKGANADIPMPSKNALADAFIKSAIGEHDPGAAVLIARDGEVLYEKGFGFANLKKNIMITPETEFRIGSVTKQFTAVAILKLQQEGKLSIDDKLSKFIPDYPRGDEVSIHHLLTHTSGIKSYTDKINFENKEVTKPIASVEAHIESFKNDPYNFDPGETWSYNNSGYFLLGYIIEQVSGQSYHAYLNQAFFQPLGMKNTGFHHKGISLKNEAIGYGYKDGKAEIAPDWEMSWAGGAGALYSTVGDLYKWNEAIFNGKVLEEANLQAAFTPVTLNDGEVSQPKYGYGWMINEFRGWNEVQHGGGLPGFLAFHARFPDQNITVTVLTNAQPPDQLNPQQAAHDLLEIFFWETMPVQESYVADENADTSLYHSYVGRYSYPGGAVLTVSAEDSQLFAQITGQPRFEIFPRGNEEFFWKVVDASIRFVPDEAGKIIQAVHSQGGQTFEAPKLEEEDVAKVDSSILETYVGEYDLNGMAVNITLEDVQLYLQVTGQPKFEIYPRSATEFFMKAVNADITFVENENNQVDQFILNQGGRSFTLPRTK